MKKNRNDMKFSHFDAGYDGVENSTYPSFDSKLL